MPNIMPTLVQRQEVVTTRVYTNPTDSAAAAVSNNKTKVPIGAIVGGIVAGIAVAVLIGGLWWWCAGRREKQRDARHKAAAAKRARQRANSGASRPSISSLRQPSTGKPGIATSESHHEKVPAVPAIPLAYHEPKNEHQYGYPQRERTTAPAPVELAPALVTSPSKESRSSRGQKSSRSRPTPSNHSSSSSSPTSPTSPKRYAPAKPSPLAAAGITAAEREKGDVGGMKWGEGPFRTPEEARRDREEAAAQQWASQGQQIQGYAPAHYQSQDAYGRNQQYQYYEEPERDYHAAAGDVGVAVAQPNTRSQGRF